MRMTLSHEDGKLILAVALLLGTQTNHYVEALAAYNGIKISYNGIQISYDRGYKKVWVEGDSIDIIRCLNNNHPLVGLLTP